MELCPKSSISIYYQSAQSDAIELSKLQHWHKQHKTPLQKLHATSRESDKTFKPQVDTEPVMQP